MNNIVSLFTDTDIYRGDILQDDVLGEGRKLININPAIIYRLKQN
jgi:hypothetical protein